jgi:hypothetical protein
MARIASSSLLWLHGSFWRSIKKELEITSSLSAIIGLLVSATFFIFVPNFCSIGCLTKQQHFSFTPNLWGVYIIREGLSSSSGGL